MGAGMRTSSIARPAALVLTAAAVIASGCSSTPPTPAPSAETGEARADTVLNVPIGPLCLAPPPLKPPNMSIMPQYRVDCGSRVQGYELTVTAGAQCPIIDLPSYGGIWWPTNFYASDPSIEDSPYPWGAQVCSYAFKNVMSYGWQWLDVRVDSGVFCGTVSYSRIVYILPTYTAEGPGPLSSIIGTDSTFVSFCQERHGGCDTCLQ